MKKRRSPIGPVAEGADEEEEGRRRLGAAAAAAADETRFGDRRMAEDGSRLEDWKGKDIRFCIVL